MSALQIFMGIVIGFLVVNLMATLFLKWWNFDYDVLDSLRGSLYKVYYRDRQ
jgi:uncharacterized membrane protein YdbT with pleckstrin-like domain